MKVEIESASNGYFIRVNDEWSDATSLIAKNDLELLQEIKDLFCNPGSRYDEKRIYIIEAPGDKNENFTEEHSRVIWPEIVNE